MARDVEAGREPELDAIAGAVLRAAARHDVPVPAVLALTRRVADRAGVAAPVA
jgi:2-dehydropantoate 2-reductase